MTDRITRKTFIRRAAASGSLLTVPGLLAACGGGGGGGGTSAGGTTQQLAKTLHFSNWTLYMDRNLKNHTFPSLIAFQKKTGTHVDYVQDINDNESFYHKIQPLLAHGQSTGRDIVVLTDNDRYLGLMLEKGYAEKLDKSAIPNIKNLIDVQKHPSFDPNRDYTLPWQSGMTGIAYNDTLTDPVLSVADLLENPKLKGKITVLNDIGDAMTLVMLANGDDPAKVTDKTWNTPSTGSRRPPTTSRSASYTGNDYAPPLAKGRPRRRDVVVGRHRADRQQAHPLERAERRRRTLDGQHADPQRRRRLHRLRLHELRVRPEGQG
jgi:Spermidine/putrescine-binding periplasmic protein